MARESVTSNEKRTHRKSCALLMSASQVPLARDLQSIFRHRQQSWASGPSRRFASNRGAGQDLEDKIAVPVEKFTIRTTCLARIPL